MRLILVLLDDLATPTAWMTADSIEVLLAQLHPLAQHLPGLAVVTEALATCALEPERAGRLDLGVLGHRHVWLLSETRHG